MVKLTWPALKVFVARAVVPSFKVTVPLGVPAPGETALTVAVNTTACPNTEGLIDEAKTLVLLAWLTV